MRMIITSQSNRLVSQAMRQRIHDLIVDRIDTNNPDSNELYITYSVKKSFPSLDVRPIEWLKVKVRANEVDILVVLGYTHRDELIAEAEASNIDIFLYRET